MATYIDLGPPPTGKTFAPEMWREKLDYVLRKGKEELGLSHDFGDAGAAEVAKKLRGAKVKKLYLTQSAVGDVGAAAVADLLRDNNETSLEWISLRSNLIGRDGIEALADALRYNNTVKTLLLFGNPGASGDPETEGGSDAEVEAAIAALVAAIGVNTRLEEVRVDYPGYDEASQRAIDAALAATEARQRGRNGPTTKAAHKS
jgi:hypothetical protein